jgi:hypothetical protein
MKSTPNNPTKKLKSSKYDRFNFLEILGYNYNFRTVPDKFLKSKIKELGYDPNNIDYYIEGWVRGEKISNLKK